MYNKKTQIQLDWPGTDKNGLPVSSGIYFYELITAFRTKKKAAHKIMGTLETVKQSLFFYPIQKPLRCDTPRTAWHSGQKYIYLLPNMDSNALKNTLTIFFLQCGHTGFISSCSSAGIIRPPQLEMINDLIKDSPNSTPIN
jgi:hypothetical protein